MKKFKIINSSKIYNYEKTIENLRNEITILQDKNSALGDLIQKMKRGERACGAHCEDCEHSYKEREVEYAWGYLDRTYGCYLDAKAACPDFRGKKNKLED